jgi:hypothetical protein
MTHFLRFASLLLASLSLAATVAAQSPANLSPENGSPRNNSLNSSLSNNEQKTPAGEQKMERIRTEDTGNRIDEVRVGGQTQSIDVQPKANVPAYQVKPDAAGSAGPAQRDAAPSAQGVRTWKIFHF